MTLKDVVSARSLISATLYLVAVMSCFALAAQVQQTAPSKASARPPATSASEDIRVPSMALIRPTGRLDGNGRRTSGPHSPVHSASVATDDINPLFLPVVLYDSGGMGAQSIAIADLNGDGNLDIAVANLCATSTNNCFNTQLPLGDGVVSVLLGNGDGTFGPATSYDSGAGAAVSVAIADLNGDGKPDLVVAHNCNNASECSYSAVGVLLGKGDGSFKPALTYASGGYELSPGGDIAHGSVVIGDVNADGKPDLVVSSQCAFGGNCVQGAVGVLVGNGDGTFQPAVVYNAGGVWTTGVALTDLNGDGKPDIALANCGPLAGGGCGSPGSVGILLAGDGGIFLPAVQFPSGGSGAMAVAIADVNDDGKPDVLVSNCGPVTVGCANGSVGVLLGNGTGVFQPAVAYGSSGPLPTSIVLTDVNGDSNIDLVISSCSRLNSPGCDNGFANVYLGTGVGSFQPPAPFPATGASTFVAAGDLNGDGKPDLVVANLSDEANGDGAIGVLLNNTVRPYNPSSISLVSSANPGIPNEFIIYTATITSQQGGPATGTVIFKDKNKTVGTRGVANNQAQWAAAYSANGTHTITASYSGDAANGFSTSAPLIEHIAVLPVSSKTIVSTSGSPSLLDQPITITAAVTSQFGVADGELVSFFDGPTVLASVPLTSGLAHFTTSSLSAKNHVIYAAYAGDPILRPSRGSIIQSVDKFVSVVALNSAPNPSAYGQALILTATVSSSGPAGVTGSVTFKNGTTALGTATLTSGTATLKTTKLPLGSDTLTATYNGDASNTRSSSTALIQTVKAARLTMKLQSTPNPSLLGKSVKFTATLSSNGGLPVGGTVRFSSAGRVLGTATIGPSGVAAFSTTALPQGSDEVKASFAANPGYSAASASVSQNVK